MNYANYKRFYFYITPRRNTRQWDRRKVEIFVVIGDESHSEQKLQGTNESKLKRKKKEKGKDNMDLEAFYL
jgi:hypothetical protein